MIIISFGVKTKQPINPDIIWSRQHYDHISYYSPVYSLHFRHTSFQVLSWEYQTYSHLRPLHWLFLLPGTIFFQISTCYFLQVFAQNSPFLWRLIWSHILNCDPHPKSYPPYPDILRCHLLDLTTFLYTVLYTSLIFMFFLVSHSTSMYISTRSEVVSIYSLPKTVCLTHRKCSKSIHWMIWEFNPFFQS